MSKTSKFKLPSVGFPKIDLSKVALPATVRDASASLSAALADKAGDAVGTIRGTLDSGFGVLRATLGGLPLLGLATTSETYDSTQVDEKHYFLLQDDGAEFGYALFILRCLPQGVPPVNDLEKRRILHLPDASALPMLKHIMLEDAHGARADDTPPESRLSGNLNALVDEIDSVDHKVFGGALAIGGLVALVNPLAGAAIAAHAMVPSVGLIATKYGLKTASRTLTNLEMSREIRRTEKDVMRQFSSSDTVSLVNPILHHLAARTPLDMWLVDGERFRFETDRVTFGPCDIRRLCDLTLQALDDAGADAEAMDYATEIASIIGS